MSPDTICALVERRIAAAADHYGLPPHDEQRLYTNALFTIATTRAGADLTEEDVEAVCLRVVEGWLTRHPPGR